MNNQNKFLLRKLSVMYYSFRFSSYYSLVIPNLSLLVGIVIIWIFIVPQIYNLFSVREEVAVTQEHINIVESNINAMQFRSSQEVDSNFLLALNALPSEKNFTGILSAIAESATIANVIMEDYAFSVGGVIKDTRSAKEKAAAAKPVEQGNKAVPVEVSLILSGSSENLNVFLKEIERKLPIAEIKTLNYENGEAQLQIAFYTKILPEVIVEDTVPFVDPVQKEKGLIQKLREWKGG